VSTIVTKPDRSATLLRFQRFGNLFPFVPFVQYDLMERVRAAPARTQLDDETYPPLTRRFGTGSVRIRCDADDGRAASTHQ
jgi:hypothetical protein